MLCDYCQKEAELVTGRVIYPHRSDLWNLNFWMCKPCKAYVGCHKGTKAPLGRLANAELRSCKMSAHESFDQIWKTHGWMTRTNAYLWLAKELNLEPKDCHIAMFDVDMCKKVIRVSQDYIKTRYSANVHGKRAS